MIVIYNPLILIETVAAGGLSFAVSKAAPKLPKSTDTLFFVLFLILIDLFYRYWRLNQKPRPSAPIDAPITPIKPPTDWSWLISLKGGHFLFVPGWVIGLLVGFFNVVI